MAMTCVKRHKECDGCMDCYESGSRLSCPICEHDLDPSNIVYMHHGEVIGCEHCVKESSAEDEESCKM